MVNPFLAKLARVKCCVKKLEYIAMAYIGVAAMLLILSMFMPRWRVDRVGTQQLSAFWVVTGFEQREYGLLQVRGSFSQSWHTVVQSACDFRTFGMVVNAGNLIGNAAGDAIDAFKKGGESDKVADLDKSCSGNDKCANGFAQHMWNRCHEYEKIFRISLVTVGCTFAAIIMSVSGVFVACLTKIPRTGGISFGLFLGGSVMTVAVNMVWAIITDLSFKRLGEDAWFPYPSLAVGYFLHLIGGFTLSASTGIFGYLVVPIAMAYDPEEEKLNKMNRKLMKQPKSPVCASSFPQQPCFPSAPTTQDPGFAAPGSGPAPLMYGQPNSQFGATPCGGPQAPFAGQAPGSNATFGFGGPGTYGGGGPPTDSVPFLQASEAADGPADVEAGGAAPPQYGHVELVGAAAGGDQAQSTRKRPSMPTLSR
mmetsp:Transcript_145062/g.404133  ORF Transcript_145062/g.404133 Transcript_145062/m.404133 type:complete len:422 (-) Transcript_145062:110-1375(-)